MSIRIAIVEDHLHFRESLQCLLENVGNYFIAGVFVSVEDALRSAFDADVLLLDIHLPGLSGIEAIHLFKSDYPQLKIVMVTGLEDDENIFNSILAGANGYILKNTAPSRILQAVEDAYLGGSPMTPIVATKAMQFLRNSVSKTIETNGLTTRENEILALIVNGLINDEIAEKLFISIQTVKNHIKHIYDKLHVHSKAQAVAKALKY